jgi:hypothetical protein
MATMRLTNIKFTFGTWPTPLINQQVARFASEVEEIETHLRLIGGDELVEKAWHLSKHSPDGLTLREAADCLIARPDSYRF